MTSAQVSPETTVRSTRLEFNDPWDLEEVYGALHDFARSQKFDAAREEYLVHITTGTHVQQICLFLLTEARYFPGKLIQTAMAPGANAERPPAGIRLSISTCRNTTASRRAFRRSGSRESRF